MTPRQPGYFVFEGIRHTRRVGHIESIHAPVEVIELVYYRKPKELAVKMIGRQQAFPLSAFEGEWKRLGLGLEVAA